MITQPYPNFIRPDAGGNVKPISNGLIYIGKEGLDPVSNPIDVFYIDNAGTEQKIDQPIRLNATGIPVAGENDGAIILPYAKSSVYSILITDKIGEEKYSNLTATGYATSSDISGVLSDIINGVVYPDAEVLKVGDSIPLQATPITHLRVLIDGKPTIVAMTPISNGYVSELSESGAIIGGSKVAFVDKFFHAQFFDSVRFEYFMGMTSNHSEALDVAIEFSNKTGVKVIGNPKTVLTINSLPSVYPESGCKIDLGGMIINSNIQSSSRGDAIFKPSGTVSEVIFATLTADVNPFEDVYFVDNPRNFSVGDYVVGQYTILQDNDTFPTGAGTTVPYEFMCKVLEVGVDYVKLNLPRSYTVSSAPPAGGSFILKRATPVKDFYIGHFVLKDVSGSTNVAHSAVAPTLCAEFLVEGVISNECRGTTAYYSFCHDFDTKYIATLMPTDVSGGRGYAEQFIACSRGESYRTKGEGARHVVDYSNGSCHMTAVRPLSQNAKDGSFGCHGSYENNITFINPEAYNGGPMVYLATSGTEFGRNCSDINVLSPKGRKMTSLIYGIAADARVNKLSVLNADYREHLGEYALRINMSRNRFEGGFIDGGMELNPSRIAQGAATDLNFKSVTILPNSNNILVATSSMDGNSLNFIGCDTSGEISQSSTGCSFSFDGGIYNFSSENLISPSAVNNLIDYFKMEGVTVNVPTGINVNTAIKTKSIMWSGNTIEIASGQTALIEIDGNNIADTSALITDNDGDFRYRCRRMKALNFSDNKQINGADQIFSVIQCVNAKLVIGNNNLKKITENAKCIDIPGGSQTGLTVTCNGNSHNGIINFGDGSTGVVTGGVATGNSYLPDSGDTNTQSVVSTILTGANFGYV